MVTVTQFYFFQALPIDRSRGNMKKPVILNYLFLAALLANTLIGCATINIGGGVVMKRSRLGDETPVTDLRTMHSASEIKAKEELLESKKKNETIKVTSELPYQGLVSPHR